MDPNTSNNNNQDTSTNTTTTNTNNNNNTQWQYPQYQVPPQQYQQVQVPNTPYHNSPKGVWVTKLIFRIFAIIFSIIVIGLAGALAGFSEDDFSWSYDGYIYYSDYWTAGPLVVWIPTVRRKKESKLPRVVVESKPNMIPSSLVLPANLVNF